MVPPLATLLCRRVQPRSRYQRRPKRYGHHHYSAGRRWPDEDLRRSLLGDHLLPPGHGRRDDGGWMAHHQNYGSAHHQAHALWRICGGDGWGLDTDGHRSFRHSSQHDAHHHGSHRGCRRIAPALGSALGRDAAHRVRLGPHHPRRRLVRRRPLPTRSPLAALDSSGKGLPSLVLTLIESVIYLTSGLTITSPTWHWFR